MAGDFDAMYPDVTPPWESGALQRALVELADHEQVSGQVVDVGRGTGENAQR
jgi:hypothetical protein